MECLGCLTCSFFVKNSNISIHVGVLNRVDSLDHCLHQETVPKLMKTCGFIQQKFFYVFLSGFYCLETLVLYRVKKFKIA